MERAEELRSMILLALADGSFDPQERELLLTRARAWGISDDQFRAMVDEEASPSVRLTLPPTMDERRRLLADLAEVIGADGKFTSLEMNIFAMAAVRMQIDAADLEAILVELKPDPE